MEQSTNIVHTLIPDWECRIRAAIRWILRSQEVTGVGGSAAYYAPIKGWGPAYPETTGYIIPTLFRAAKRFREPHYAEAALGMADWLLTLQNEEGWFPAGTWRPGKKRQPSIFNTGQILFGIVAAAKATGDLKYWSSAKFATDWLISQQDSDGRWRKWSYRQGHSPSYYAHVCWPLAEYLVAREPGNRSLRATIVTGAEAILEDRNENGTFSGWAFVPNKPAFTHTIAYTLQGLLETAHLLGAVDKIGTATIDSLERLMRRVELSKGLGGTYGDDWQAVMWYQCLTGNCQLASAWMRVFTIRSDPRFLNVACKALIAVSQMQKLRRRENICGAIPGSKPLYGRYMAGRYPNWAAKFFVDALLDLEQSFFVADVIACKRATRNE